jgi:hypothetical protein
MAEAETRGRGVEALWRLGIGGGLDAGGGGGGGTLFGGGARDEFFFFGRNYFRKQCNVKKTPSRVAWAVEVFIKISLTFSNYYLMAFG